MGEGVATHVDTSVELAEIPSGSQRRKAMAHSLNSIINLRFYYSVGQDTSKSWLRTVFRNFSLLVKPWYSETWWSEIQKSIGIMKINFSIFSQHCFIQKVSFVFYVSITSRNKKCNFYFFKDWVCFWNCIMLTVLVGVYYLVT